MGFNLGEAYIDGITAKYFDEREVKDSHITISKKGWYWADDKDNARYSDWSGPFETKEQALTAGKSIRKLALENMKESGFYNPNK